MVDAYIAKMCCTNEEFIKHRTIGANKTYMKYI